MAGKWRENTLIDVLTGDEESEMRAQVGQLSHTAFRNFVAFSVGWMVAACC